ncbi:MAG: phosphotransferase [Acidobacteria bacterium]|nr:phosphotransferase [Acidobacteriota bacterium]
MSDLQLATDLCLSLYGLKGEVRPIPDGRAQNFFVGCDASRWLLKIFQHEYSKSRIEQAAGFISFLAGQGFPCRTFQPSLHGNPVETVGGQAVVLVPWIDGLGLLPNSVDNPGTMREIGVLCGWLHRLGGEYSQRDAFSFSGKDRTPEIALQRLTELGAVADEGIAQQVRDRCQILRQLGDELAESRAQATRGIIHGDFYCTHAIFRAGRPVGVIDILGDLNYPGWELMRAYFQSAPPQAPAALFQAFLNGYRSEQVISDAEVAAAYDVYLLQLTSSTYGLLPSSDANLREFGAWRTRTAIWLAAERTRLIREFTSA